MTAGDWALLVGLLANALATFFGLRQVRRKVVDVDRKVVAVHQDVVGVAAAANGMKDALVTAAGIAGELKGRADEKREEAERRNGNGHKP